MQIAFCQSKTMQIAIYQSRNADRFANRNADRYAESAQKANWIADQNLQSQHKKQLDLQCILIFIFDTNTTP